MLNARYLDLAGLRHARREQGATMIEFAAILLPLLILFYGIIIYSLVFVTQQAVAFAAERGADASVAVDPTLTVAAFQNLANDQATAQVDDLLAFLPGGPDSVNVVVTEPADANPARRVRVTVDYSFGKWGLPAPAFLPLPNLIQGVGVAAVGGTGS